MYKLNQKLKGIEPFNLTYFRSCYYHQLLSAYPHFGANPEILSLSEIPVYYYNDEQKDFGMRSVSLYSKQEIEQISGIKTVPRKKVFDLTSSLVTSIDRGNPVIIGIDPFYVPSRKDCFRISHAEHYVLVYGYSWKEREWVVNEHCYKNSQRYREINFPMKIIIHAAEKFCQRFPEKIAFTKIMRAQSSSVKFSLKDYRVKFQKIWCDLKGGVNDLEKFFTKVLDNKFLEQEYMNIFLKLYDIRRKKVTQNYVINQFISNEYLFEKQKRIQNLWVYIYGMFVRMIKLGQFTNENICLIRTAWREVLDLEWDTEILIEENL